MEKLLRDITDGEWIRYRWLDITSTRDTERRFLQIRENTPEEAAEAARKVAEAREAITALPTGVPNMLRRLFGMTPK